VENIKIAVIGLGYVGLPVAISFGKKCKGVIGFDVSRPRVEGLKAGKDKNGDVSDSDISSSNVTFSYNEDDLKSCNFFIVAVPTPIDEMKRPDLSPLIGASEIIGRVISKGAIVVFESTVYPGVTEDICGPTISRVSGYTQSIDFFLGYSPERINPGDTEHRLETIVKVVSGENEETLHVVSKVYGMIIDAGVHKASSIKVAEAAKVIENTQRDLNIALMNELSIIFDKMNVPSRDVFDAAATKWNFLRFYPGLVGGHCIGVDPYYLTTKAEQLGYRPQVILSGRRINDGMGAFIANRAVKLMIGNQLKIKGAKVGILGLTFKENVSDIRNSRVPDIIQELKEFGIHPVVHDPVVNPDEVKHEFGLEVTEVEEFRNLDCLIIAVSHAEFISSGFEKIRNMISKEGVLLDIKGAFYDSHEKESITYWSL
jgi:UDP-N-acetyl-D-glucosamine/UDP-N-acetyl-D-galactosamine dehydrogenase